MGKVLGTDVQLCTPFSEKYFILLTEMYKITFLLNLSYDSKVNTVTLRLEKHNVENVYLVERCHNFCRIINCCRFNILSKAIKCSSSKNNIFSI